MTLLLLTVCHEFRFRGCAVLYFRKHHSVVISYSVIDLNSHTKKGKHQHCCSRSTTVFSFTVQNSHWGFESFCYVNMLLANRATIPPQLLEVSKWWESSSAKLEQRPRWAMANISFEIHSLLQKILVWIFMQMLLSSRCSLHVYQAHESQACAGISEIKPPLERNAWAEKGIVREKSANVWRVIPLHIRTGAVM